MANVKIRGHTLNIDIQAELEEFEWHRAKWASNKLIAASPFRYDKSPSFFVNLEGDYAGCWGDSGAYDEEWSSGGIVKLLSYLRNETYEESEQYLLEKYDYSVSKDGIKLNITKITMTRRTNVISRAIMKEVSPYLTKRGISTQVQTEARVGKSEYYGFVAIPWNSPDGNLANIKYRATKGKTFFYERGARPIRELVYGADLYVKSTDDLIICEAEIDALSWRTAGYNAVAVGGVAFTKYQADILRRLPFKRLVVAGDNDKAGARFNEQVIKAMIGRETAVLEWRQSRFKDANDVLVNNGIGALIDAFEQAIDLPTISVNLRAYQ